MARSQDQFEHPARTLNLSTDEAERHASRLTASWEGEADLDSEPDEDPDSQDVWAFTDPHEDARHTDDTIELPPAVPMSHWTGAVLLGGVAFLGLLTAVVLVGVDVKAMGGGWVSKLGPERTTTSINAITERHDAPRAKPAPARAQPPSPAPAAAPVPALAQPAPPPIATTEPAKIASAEKRVDTNRRTAPGARRAAQRTAQSPSPEHVNGANITVRLRTIPADATLRIDGALVPNPYEGDFQASAEPHRIEVQAPGYKDLSTTLAFDSDLTQTLRLHAEVTRTPPSSASSNTDLMRDFDEPEEEIGSEAQREPEEPAHADEPGLIDENPY